MNKKLHKAAQKDMRRVFAYSTFPCNCNYVTCGCGSTAGKPPQTTVFNQMKDANFGTVYQH